MGDSVNPNLGNYDAFLVASLLGTRSMNLVIWLVWFLLLKWHWCVTQNPALKMAKTLPLHDDSLVSFFNFWILNWGAFQTSWFCIFYVKFLINRLILTLTTHVKYLGFQNKCMLPIQKVLNDTFYVMDIYVLKLQMWWSHSRIT